MVDIKQVIDKSTSVKMEDMRKSMDNFNIAVSNCNQRAVNLFIDFCKALNERNESNKHDK